MSERPPRSTPDRTPPERREALLERFEESGMTSNAFAEHHGIKYTTFANWVQQPKTPH